MKPVFLPQPEAAALADPAANASSAAITKWHTDLRQVTRQWLRAGGEITKWLEDYGKLRQHIVSVAWQHTVPRELDAQASYILLGASARGEDTLSSDLDYALLLSPQSTVAAEELRPYLYQFGHAMSRLGVQPCPGNVMATNPRWFGTIHQWKERIYSYFQYPSWENTRYLFILIDSLPILSSPNDETDFLSTTQCAGTAEHGDPLHRDVWDDLRQEVIKSISQSPYMCWEMAHLGIHNTVPNGVRLGSVFSSLSSRHKSVSLKANLINPIVHSVRLLSIVHGIPALSTVRRLEELTGLHVLDRSLKQSIEDSLRYGWKMRILSAIEKPIATDDADDLQFAKLPASDRDELVTHLQTARKLERMIHGRFKKPR